MLIAKIVAALVLVYGLAVLGVAVFQSALIYFPDKRRVDPATLSLAPINEHVIETPDGERVIAWYIPAATGKPTLLYFHGNGGALIDRAVRFQRFHGEGFGLFMMSYRGYSGSTGTPSEANNIADADLAWQTLVGMGVDPKDIVLYGESLGTGVAVQIAARHAPRALVLEAAYSSLLDIGAVRFPVIPVRWLSRHRYNSVGAIGKVHAPLLMIHGENDITVPIRFGRKLFEAANEPKRFIAYPGAGHMETYNHGAFADVLAFLNSL